MITRLPYHLVELRPWPIILAARIILLALGIIEWLHFNNLLLISMSLLLTILSLSQWWRDIFREATIIGKHTIKVQQGLRIGIILFIISEVCFFISFFWAFFHSRFSPTPDLGCIWPPIGIDIIDPIRVPLLNTIILLTSGFTLTWRHHRLLIKKRITAIIGLLMTIILGSYFTLLQSLEYINTRFSVRDRALGSTFFITTGFHGLHVIIGTLFLIVNLYRIKVFHFSSLHHFRFEAAAWYWHFVDVIWICLYICIYWWGS